MSTVITDKPKTAGELGAKLENPKQKILQYGINAEHFKISVSVCSDMLLYIKRGEMDSRYKTADRVAFIRDTLEKFYERHVLFRGKPGIVVALRIKSISRLAFERKTGGHVKTGDMEAYIKHEHPRYKPVWVDTKRLVVVG